MSIAAKIAMMISNNFGVFALIYITVAFGGLMISQRSEDLDTRRNALLAFQGSMTVFSVLVAMMGIFLMPEVTGTKLERFVKPIVDQLKDMTKVKGGYFDRRGAEAVGRVLQSIPRVETTDAPWPVD